MLNAVLDEGSQVRLADPAYGVDVSTGAVVLGQVAEEAAARENTWSGQWARQPGGRAVQPPSSQDLLPPELGQPEGLGDVWYGWADCDGAELPMTEGRCSGPDETWGRETGLP